MADEKSCIFCRIIRREIKSEVVAESNSFIAIKDANPDTEGHTLVMPKQHFVTLLDIPEKYGGEMLRFTKQVAFELMHQRYGDGFNIVMNNLPCAGQVIMHAHLHIIPRKEGDGIRFFKKE